MFKFENLHVYQDAIEFVHLIYNYTKVFPKDELFGITSQLRRAALSIVLNIAEGTSRTKKDFQHFINIARGSCFECAAILQIAFEQEYISKKEYDLAYEKCEILSKRLNALKSSLK